MKLRWIFSLICALMVFAAPAHAAIKQIIGGAVNLDVCTLNMTQQETLAARVNTGGGGGFEIDASAGVWFLGINQTSPVQTGRIETGTLNPLTFTAASASLASNNALDIRVIANPLSQRVFSLMTNSSNLPLLREFSYALALLNSATGNNIGSYSPTIDQDSLGVFTQRSNGLGNPVAVERFDQASLVNTTANGPNVDTSNPPTGALRVNVQKTQVYSPNSSGTNLGIFVSSPISFSASLTPQTTTAVSSSLADSTAGFAYFSSNQDLRKIRLSDNTLQGTILSGGVIAEGKNLLAFDLPKGKLYWAARTPTNIDFRRIDLASFSVEQTLSTLLGGSGMANGLHVDSTAQRMYYADSQNNLTAFSLCD